MNISEKITQEKLQEILLTIYNKGEENEDINTIEMINEIKHQLLTVTNSK